MWFGTDKKSLSGILEPPILDITVAFGIVNLLVMRTYFLLPLNKRSPV